MSPRRKYRHFCPCFVNYRDIHENKGGAGYSDGIQIENEGEAQVRT